MAPTTRQSITQKKYCELEKRNHVIDKKKKVIVKTALFTLMEKYPCFWQHNVRGSLDQWILVRAEVYEQTGEVVPERELREMFTMAKKFLKTKIMKSIRNSIDHDTMEAQLRQWKFFPFIGYYYKSLAKFESTMRKKQAENGLVSAALMEDDTLGEDTEEDISSEEDDDIVVVDEIIRVQSPRSCIQNVKPQQSASSPPAVRQSAIVTPSASENNRTSNAASNGQCSQLRNHTKICIEYHFSN
ncbi:MADF domain-containing protein [Caenorhabditis elegans]|uniref:MADF domain-containing protein n=1 Tax=Caenorhabditis elegans TaxID=6239 RepID=Q17812_CAEEL|nr:MADF domain-containing protein [Caenorhabditis elegans]CCD63621.1 MADF domain-containing protein [Caenorhabditis elegans]|eukprot:NP_510768.2 LIn-8 Domain containing [Caenorhabditis elegans]